MTPSKSPAWADGPFTLLETPKYRYQQDGKKVDEYVEAATQMALVHNGFIRALNAIYQVAPNVPPSDLANFVAYSMQVHGSIKMHHNEEEMYFFPDVEAKTKAGIMQGNVEQHAAFESKLDAFGSYLTDLHTMKTTATFSPTKFRELVDDFREPVQRHLADEIPSLLALSKFGDFGLAKLMEDGGNKAVAAYSIVANLPVIFLNQDQTYEGGIHGLFPPISVPGMSLFVRRVATWWHPGWWKFAACDGGQLPKALPY